MAHFGDMQNEIYLRGLGGECPELPMTADGLEHAARGVLSAEVFGYIAGGASSERTVAANREAFARWRIVPRMLRTVIERDLSTTVLGTPMTAPVLTAPVGVLGHVHPDADRAVTRAAAALGIPSVLSTVASTSIEDVAAVAPEAPRWYQLYWPRDHELAESLVRRAEAAGNEAIVVTLDAWRWAGGHATCSSPTCRSCAPRASPTTSPTRSSAPGCPTHRRSRKRPCSGPFSPVWSCSVTRR